MVLPRLDMPIGIVHWEVLVPARFTAQAVAGIAIDLRRVSKADNGGLTLASHVPPGVLGGLTGGVSEGASGMAPGRNETAATIVAETVTVTAESPPAETAFDQQPSQDVVNSSAGRAASCPSGWMCRARGRRIAS